MAYEMKIRGTENACRTTRRPRPARSRRPQQPNPENRRVRSGPPESLFALAPERRYLTLSRSTMKTRVSFGGITGGEPLGP